LLPFVTTNTTSGLKLPEHALDSCEVGFSFTYMKPRRFHDEIAQWDKEEDFYEVKCFDQEQPRSVHISPYTGFGLRLRHTLLSLVDTIDRPLDLVPGIVGIGKDKHATERVKVRKTRRVGVVVYHKMYFVCDVRE
jgi:hypothetical protein